MPSSAAAPGASRRGRPQSAAHNKWVHHPLSDLWRLAQNSKGALEWREVQATGAAPFPRSRHTMEAVANRGLVLLFGGRSVQASTVLSDMYALDVSEWHWVCVTLCGVPPSPRECAAVTVVGASLFLFGGRGRTCHHDAAVFHLSPEARAGMMRAASVAECPGTWEHPFAADVPSRRQGHNLVALGSRRVLTFGGYCNDDNTFAGGAPMEGELAPYAMGMMLALHAVEPAAAPVEGGVQLTIHGTGFRPQNKLRVRFTVPHPPPPPPAAKDAASLSIAPPPICLAEAEPFAIVTATYVDSTTITCITPDMSDKLCDGAVLIEVCSSDKLKVAPPAARRGPPRRRRPTRRGRRRRAAARERAWQWRGRARGGDCARGGGCGGGRRRRRRPRPPCRHAERPRGGGAVDGGRGGTDADLLVRHEQAPPARRDLWRRRQPPHDDAAHLRLPRPPPLHRR